jgi:acyl carrier protein
MSSTEQLHAVFAEALGIELAQVLDSLSYNSIPQWDSTAHMILIAELENSFSVMLDTDDIIDMSSVAMAKEILGKYDIEF